MEEATACPASTAVLHGARTSGTRPESARGGMQKIAPRGLGSIPSEADSHRIGELQTMVRIARAYYLHGPSQWADAQWQRTDWLRRRTRRRGGRGGEGNELLTRAGAAYVGAPLWVWQHVARRAAVAYGRDER